MRKIVISDYKVKARNQDTGEFVDAPYNVKVSLVAIIFNRDLNLSADELLDRDVIGHKIKGCPNGHVLLEESEYQILLKGVDTVRGYTENDIELVKRVKEAEQVNVKEK